MKTIISFMKQSLLIILIGFSLHSFCQTESSNLEKTPPTSLSILEEGFNQAPSYNIMGEDVIDYGKDVSNRGAFGNSVTYTNSYRATQLIAEQEKVNNQKRIFLAIFFGVALIAILAFRDYTKERSNIKKNKKLGADLDSTNKGLKDIIKKKEQLREIFNKSVISKDEYEKKLKVLNKEHKAKYVEYLLNKNDYYISILSAHKKGLLTDSEKKIKVAEKRAEIESEIPNTNFQDSTIL